MFGHDRRSCGVGNNRTGQMSAGERFVVSMDQYDYHGEINRQWVDCGGAGHTVPVPEPHTVPEQQMPKTPYELACENDCKITETAECCICMEDLTEKNKVTTACGHQFHFGCVSHPTIVNCPMCRAIIKP